MNALRVSTVSTSALTFVAAATSLPAAAAAAPRRRHLQGQPPPPSSPPTLSHPPSPPPPSPPPPTPTPSSPPPHSPPPCPPSPSQPPPSPRGEVGEGDGAQTSDWAPGVAGLRLCYAHRHPFHSNLAKTMGMLHRHWTAKDIMVMNSGMWHRDYFNLTKHTVEGVLDYASKNNNSVPSLFWRETSPQHFVVPYSTHECLDPPTCSMRNTTAPMRSSLPQCVPCSEADWKGCITAKRHNEVARAVLAGRPGAMKLVRIWNRTVPD